MKVLGALVVCACARSTLHIANDDPTALSIVVTSDRGEPVYATRLDGGERLDIPLHLDGDRSLRIDVVAGGAILVTRKGGYVTAGFDVCVNVSHTQVEFTGCR